MNLAVFAFAINPSAAFQSAPIDANLLKFFGQVAGIGGLALGVLLLVFRDVIRKNIFPTLSKDHGYKLLRLIIVLVWIVALVGIGAWVYTTKGDETSYKQPKLTDDQRKRLEDELKAATWCRENNRPAQALEHYRNALQIDKDNPDIREAIRQVQQQIGGRIE